MSKVIWLVALAFPGQQPTETGTPPADVGTAPITPEQQQELDDIVHVITSERNDPPTRRFGAERLLRSSLPGNTAATIRLLTTSPSPGTVTAVCDAITTTGRRRPELLDNGLVEPLLAFLGDDDPALSTAAASALSVFRDTGVARQLGAIAADGQRPLPQRLAAIDALAVNTDSLAGIQELVALLSVDAPPVVEHALDALRPASRVDYGSDLKAWRTWWDRKSSLTNEQWLRDRLDLAIDRFTSLSNDYQQLQRERQQRDQVITDRLKELLWTIYQLTPQTAQKETRIQQWLTDSLVDFRLCALGLIRTQILEGKVPPPEVRDAVKSAFNDESPEVRIAAMEIVGNMKDPADAPALLEQFPKETHPGVRETAVRVLGRLENPIAIADLLDLLNDPQANSGLIREAALSIGMLGAKGRVESAVLEPAIAPLKQRLHDSPGDDLALREALLRSMAMIGSPQFKPEFVEHLSSSKPELVLAAIRGIQVIEARDQMDRLLSLLANVDPRVRQLAAGAIGALGQPPHLEALFNRLTPNVEANDGVRAAAWDAFRAILGRGPVGAYLPWVNRLDDTPDRQIQILTELIDLRSANGAGNGDEELIEARERFVDVCMKAGRSAEAIPHLQWLRRHYLEADPVRAADVGVELLRVIIQNGRGDRLRETILEITQSTDDQAKERIAGQVLDLLSAQVAAGGADAVATVLPVLQSLPPGTLGPTWPARFNAFTAPSSGSAGPPARPPDDSGTP